MNAATTSEWLAAFLVGAAGLLPFAAAMSLAGRDLPHLPEDPVRDVAERAQLLLALTRHLETGASR